jgi:F-type H+-transporting ATPase subunit b
MSWVDVALQGINFLVLVWLLERVLYRPVLAVIARRRQEVQERLDGAAAERARADALRAELEGATAALAGQADRTLEAARARAEEEAALLRDAARREAAAIVDDGRRRLARDEVEQAQRLTSAAGELAAVMAERLLRDAGASPTALLLERTLVHVEDLDPARREALRRGLDGGAVTLATAVALAEEERAAATTRLARGLGVQPERVAFALDPSLLGGAEVRLPSCAVGFTWRGALDQLAQEVSGASSASDGPGGRA